MIDKVNLRDSYKYYKANAENPVDINTYLKIVLGFIKFIMRKVFEGFDVQLSGGRSLGSIGVRGKKRIGRLNDDGEIRGLAPDWCATHKLWKEVPEAKINKEIIYHTNEHTNNVSYKLVWWRQGMNIGNKLIYSLVFTIGPKGNKRALSRMIKDGKEYLVNP